MLMQHRIVKASYVHEFCLYDAIEEWDDYTELFEVLGEATEDDGVVLRVNSPGGRTDIGMMIVKAIKQSKATVAAHIVDYSASMASVIACACDTLVMDADTYLMFHNYSGGAYGKGEDLVQHVLETHRCLDSAHTRIVCPFLTKKEISSLRSGKDIYVTWDSVGLQERIKRHYK